MTNAIYRQPPCGCSFSFLRRIEVENGVSGTRKLLATAEMGKIEEISEDEIARLAQASGLYEKLPPDFVPSRPGQKQSQPAARHAWHHRSDEGDEDDEDRFVDDSDEEDEDDEQYASRSGTAQELMEAADRDGLNPTLEEVFDVIIWTMPFAFLFLMFDILIQQQYAQEPTFLGELAKMAVNVPSQSSFHPLRVMFRLS